MLKRLLPVLGVAGVLFMLAPQARAMCVYSEMDVALRVVFDCGSFCENDWEIQPGSYACRPNKGGTVYGGGESISLFTLYPQAHDYVVMSTIDGRQRQACLYRSDDSLVGCMSFTYPW